MGLKPRRPRVAEPPSRTPRLRALTRPAIDDDYDELYALHVSSMKEYVAATYGWEDDVQRRMFREDWTVKSRGMAVVTLGNEIVAAYRVKRSEEVIYLASIEVRPSHQGQGIGTRIVRALLDEGRTNEKPVVLFVMKANARARRLYERLGFSVSAETATHFKMVSPRPSKRIRAALTARRPRGTR